MMMEMFGNGITEFSLHRYHYGMEILATKKDVLKGTQDGETHQKHQQDKEKEYYKQKLKHNPILK